MNKRKQSSRCGAAGFVLLEVLVSILILAFGVLGMIGLQAAAVQHTTTAKYRADASFLASRRIGEVWANPEALGSFIESNTDVSALLPGGKRTTTVDAASRRVTVTVSWQAPAGTGPSNVVMVAHIGI